MSQELNDFIGQLTSIRDKELVSIYIPTIGTTCNFLPLNMRQQKELLRTTGEGAAGLINFNLTLLNIILENSIDKTIEFNSFDRYSILLALRKDCFGTSVKNENITYSLDTLVDVSKVDICSLTKEISYKGIKLKLKNPSLKKDIEFLTYCFADVKKNKQEDALDAVAALYILELVKVIESVSIKDVEIEFQNLSINEKKRVIENIPVQLVHKIVSFITSVRDVENKYITFDDGTVVQFNTLFFPVD